MEGKNLRDHVVATYLTLRIGVAALALALPLLLSVGGLLLADLELQTSMSAYYHAGYGAMRNVFTGVLIAVAAFLVLYKGFTAFENWALNLAGVFLIGVALVPMEWNCKTCSGFSAHGTFAVLFFLAIAYVCIFRAWDTLGLIRDKDRASAYQRFYRLMGWGMIASPAIAVALTFVLQPRSDAKATVFFTETVGVLFFAIYWIVKSLEIARTDAERSALEGELLVPAHGLADLFKPICVRRVERPGPRGT